MTAHRLAEDLRTEKSSTGSVILLVDDDDEARETVSMILEQLGYCVVQAGSGDEALEVAEKMAGKLGLLLTDVRMPGMNGVELARRMRAHFPRTPVVFVSGFAAGALTESDEVASRAAFLSKPFSVDDLDSAIRSALAREEGH